MSAESDLARVVGIDLGGATVSAAVVDPTGTVLGAVEHEIDRARPPQEVLEATVAAIREALKQSRTEPSDLRAIGLGMPGTLRPSEGLCLFSATMNWENIQVREPIAQAFGVPVVIINTVGAIAQGEKYFGVGRDQDNYVCVSLGNTIGGAVIIHGQVYNGDSDSAGEVGHVTVDPDGPQCTCGNQGCLEALAAGPAIARMAAESLKLGAQSLLADWAADGTPITADHVYRAAREGDALAIKIWEKVGRYLGLALAAVITLINPPVIVMGGRVSAAFEFFAPTMREEVRRRARMVPRDFTRIVPSPLGLQAVLMGSAAAAFDRAGVQPALPLTAKY